MPNLRQTEPTKPTSIWTKIIRRWRVLSYIATDLDYLLFLGKYILSGDALFFLMAGANIYRRIYYQGKVHPVGPKNRKKYGIKLTEEDKRYFFIKEDYGEIPESQKK